nr:BglG family transcription antiterminator [Thalassobacillus sp. CUG 92003]
MKEVITNPSVTSKDLEKKYGLNRRQLKYSFEKINGWLASKNLPTIERTRQGLFVVDPMLFSTLLKEDEQPSDANIPSESERVDMILVMLLSHEEELSLVHFTSELDVSKNTVLSDLKKAQHYVEQFELAIHYSRKQGYEIEGKEFSVRKLLIATTSRMLDMHRGSQRLEELAGLTEDAIATLKERVERVEEKLNLQFTDEKIQAMPYVLSLVLRRVKQGQLIEPFYIQYEELFDTKECKATEEILYDYEQIPMPERLFITLHLLTSNVYWSQDLTEESIPELLQALDEMLTLFERRSCIVLQDKEQLLNRLLLHVKPAYYRIKYKLTGIYGLEDRVSQEFQELHHIVRKSTAPLARLIGEDIPESEVAYLTMLIGGWLTKQGDSLQEKVKALVVCPKGISVSRLLLSDLRELFPEFVFLDALSIRDFQEYGLDYDIIFSPVYLETDKKLFFVNAVLEQEEKYRLRKQVMSELHGSIPPDMDVEHLVEIIEKYASIEKKHSLLQELQHYMHPGQGSNAHVQNGWTPHLKDFLSEPFITLGSQVETWEAAVREGAQLLVAEGKISETYVEAMLNQDQEDPYIILGNNIAIPHASPEDGVNEVAMSLLTLDQSVTFAEHEVNLIVIIAAVDKYHHLKALRQLMKLSGEADDVDALVSSETTEGVQTILNKYAEE